MWRRFFGHPEQPDPQETEEKTSAGPSGKIQMTPQDLQERIRQDPPPLILDVREPWEYQKARIEGSVLVPMREIPGHMDSLPRDQEIIVVCHHGVRSMQVLYFLSQQGFTRLRNLMGGIDAWSSVDPKVPRY
jgi:rhodanese-related sulfurtransferase